METCIGYEVVCPDGLVRSYPYHDKDGAESHVKHANDPAWFANRRCRLAPKPSELESSKPPCQGGEHHVRPILMQHTVVERGES